MDKAGVSGAADLGDLFDKSTAVWISLFAIKALNRHSLASNVVEIKMIETERLILRPTIQDDLQLYRALFQDPDIVRYLPGGEPYSCDYIANYVSNKLAHWEKGFGTFTVTLKNHPEVCVGYAGIEQAPDSHFHDIRYGFLPSYQGLGFATEAARASIEFVFENRFVEEVFGVAVVDNLPSVRILQKLAMTPSSATLYESDDLVTFSIRR